MWEVEARRRGELGPESPNAHGDRNTNGAAERGEECAFQEKLHEDAAIGCAQGFQQADLARALANAHEHNVHDSNGPENQRHQAYTAEEQVHAVKNLANHVLRLHGIPAFKRLFIVDVKSVVPRDDPVRLLHGRSVFVACDRPHDQVADVVRRVRILDGKILFHHGKRHVDARILAAIFLPPDIGQNAHHLNLDAVQQNRASDRRPAGKQVAHHLKAQNTDQPALIFIGIIQPAAFGLRQVANLVEDRFGAAHPSVSVGKIALRFDVAAPNHRRDIQHISGFALDVLIIFVGEHVAPHALALPFHRRYVPAPEKDHILADVGHVLLLSAAEALAHADQKQQRPHTPGNTKHGEEGAQLMRPQRAQHLTKDVEDHSHSQHSAISSHHSAKQISWQDYHPGFPITRSPDDPISRLWGPPGRPAFARTRAVYRCHVIRRVRTRGSRHLDAWKSIMSCLNFQCYTRPPRVLNKSSSRQKLIRKNSDRRKDLSSAATISSLPWGTNRGVNFGSG